MASKMNLLIQHGDDWLSFSNPVEVLTARTKKEIFHCLEAITLRQSASRRGGDHLFQGLENGAKEGLWAAGFVSYEAASAFDEVLSVFDGARSTATRDGVEPVPPLPLLQFGLFAEPEFVGQIPSSAIFSQAGTPAPQKNYQLGEWEPSVTRDEYVEAIAQIKERIAAGDTYQVNYTFRLNANFKGDPFAFFCDLAAAQQGRYGAFIETDDFAICSASPELFFELKDGVITSRPMKGTLPRGLTFSKDWKNAETLKNSTKDRAENIMIVDMIRNDIGRIAEAGSVETFRRFAVEKYPTVWQMTSTIKGKVAATSCRSSKRQDAASTLGDLFTALFPCASITGAPKAKTMEIIQTLEASSRGVYTGAIGFVAPDGAAQFNVAIRTAVIQDGKAEYGIGGGIVWDSNPEDEYREALSKAAILTKKMPEFQLLETMLWEEGKIFLLERHLKRLAESAEYFDFKVDSEKIRVELESFSFNEPKRIRLLLNRNGSFKAEAAPSRLPRQNASATLAIARDPVSSDDVFLYHKTTNRAVYENAKADFPDADDVLLFNGRGEVTESTIANIVVELNGRKVTPPVSCGLLAGTFRDELLESGEIEEEVVSLEDFKRADSISLINSVRKWRHATLV